MTKGISNIFNSSQLLRNLGYNSSSNRSKYLIAGALATAIIALGSCSYNEKKENTTPTNNKQVVSTSVPAPSKLDDLLAKEESVGLADWNGDCVYDEIILRPNEKYGKGKSDYGVFYVRYDDGGLQRIGRGSDLVAKILSDCDRDFGMYEHNGKGLKEIVNSAVEKDSYKLPFINMEKFEEHYNQRPQRNIRY